MTRLTLMSMALVLSMSGALFAQDWREFANREDRFTCNFPGPPKVTETTYRSEHGADLPARVYSAAQGQSRYSVTVVDYTRPNGYSRRKPRPARRAPNPAWAHRVMRATGKPMCEARLSTPPGD